MAEVEICLDDERLVQLSDEPGKVDVDALWSFLSVEAYWGRWRSEADVTAQVSGSWRIVSARVGDEMVGFARAVSDGVALAYLADVYVVAGWRGHGLGKAIIQFMVDDGPGRDFRWLLHTSDGQGVYERFGFKPAPTDAMERPGRL